MREIDPTVEKIVIAMREGRNDEALHLLIGLFETNGNTGSGASHFMTMFMWGQLVADYQPARIAYARARDEQVRLLLNGSQNFGNSSKSMPRTRFAVIADMNGTLDEQPATYELFVQLESLMPELARRQAFLALPSIVEAGDFVLAERYLPDPMHHLEELNKLACEMPLFPSIGAAPRLGAELSNFMKDVRLRCAIVQGLGRESEADELRNTALSGIVSDEMRALAQREISAPGTIIRELSEHRSSLD